MSRMLLRRGRRRTRCCRCGRAPAVRLAASATVADPIIGQMTRPQLEKLIAETTRRMKEAAKQMDFMQAAQYRDEIIRMQKELELK